MMMISGIGIGSHKHTNSVDPDQTAHFEQSDLDLHCLRVIYCVTLRIRSCRAGTARC